MTNGVSHIQIPNYSGVNIQIYNPAVIADGATTTPSTTVNNCSTNPVSYPANYYTQNFSTNTTKTVVEPNKKTKKEIVELTDNYVKTLEYYLNTQDTALRTMAAKEVVERMKEDKSRKNDEVLIAFNNKMLKDASQPIRFLAMGAIEAGYIKGNEETVDILNKLQAKRNSDSKITAEDATKAAKALVQLTKTTKEIEG